MWKSDRLSNRAFLAEPNRIHVSEPVAGALRGSFDLEPRGTVDLKGKGDTESYFLRGPAG